MQCGFRKTIRSNFGLPSSFAFEFSLARGALRVTMFGMSLPYEQLLAATIAHLENLQARGQRHVVVAPETLRELTAAKRPQPVSQPARSGRSISQRTPAVSASSGAPLIPMPPPVVARATVSRGGKVVSPTTAPGDPAKVAAFADLRQRAMNCVKCPNLVAARKSVVFGVGNIDAELMFVGEAPGADEDQQGEPFVGKAGQLLTKIIETMGLQRTDVYIGNILKCRPDTPGQSSGNRKPTTDEMATCIPYLHEQIDLIKPKVLVALGATAVEGLLGKTVGITRLRGNWKIYRGIPLMPTYHPAYLLRNQALREKRNVWEDMLQVMEKLGMPISEKQRAFFLKAKG